MALALTTITNSIAALTVTGLTIYDIDEIPEAALRDVPCMYPEPVEFLTNFEAEMASFQGCKWNVGYDMTYTLLYAPVGSGRGMELFSSTVALAFLVVDAVTAIQSVTGAVTLKFVSISTPGPITDPAGNSYFGVRITFRALEFVN